VKKLHIDKRAADLLATTAAGEDGDDLLSTAAVAAWLGVSTVFLISGRTRGYGPKFTRVSPTVIRYRRSEVIKWLESRTFSSNAEDPHIGNLGRRPRREPEAAA
jgi:hypothetical protein